jgi:hypothetical protein
VAWITPNFGETLGSNLSAFCPSSLGTGRTFAVIGFFHFAMWLGHFKNAPFCVINRRVLASPPWPGTNAEPETSTRMQRRIQFFRQSRIAIHLLNLPALDVAEKVNTKLGRDPLIRGISAAD